MNRSAPKELAEHLLVSFPSSEQPLLSLFMDVLAPAHGGPWPPLLLFHGWHQDLTSQRERARFFARRGFCALNLNLRGRCGTVGQPDANGWEIRDPVDAVAAARRFFPRLCAANLPPRAFGASGGGGNVYALTGKCPDFLSAAVAWCGVSDYAQWHEWNEKGNYRDEMDKWIAPNPREAAEAYRSRSGAAVAPNRLCPLSVLHGVADDSVPVAQARAYAEAAKGVARGVPPLEYHELPGVGHDIPEDPHLGHAAEYLLKQRKPVTLPQRGHWVVAGFLKTHYFEVRWDHVGLIGSLDMDLRRKKFHLLCPNSAAAQVRIAGMVSEPELTEPVARNARILSVREERGWTVLDLQCYGEPLALRWKA